MNNQESGPAPSAEKATATGVNSSDPMSAVMEAFAAKARVRARERLGLSIRAESSSSVAAEDKTILGETANLLGGDLFETMLAFLPVDQLMFLRSLSKDTKTKVDEMISKRALQQPPTLDLE